MINTTVCTLPLIIDNETIWKRTKSSSLIFFNGQCLQHLAQRDRIWCNITRNNEHEYNSVMVHTPLNALCNLKCFVAHIAENYNTMQYCSNWFSLNSKLHVLIKMIMICAIRKLTEWLLYCLTDVWRLCMWFDARPNGTFF